MGGDLKGRGCEGRWRVGSGRELKDRGDEL